MAKVKVLIEEHLVKEVEIDCPDSMTREERLEHAKEAVIEQYTNEDIVLTSDDYNGTTLIYAEDEESGAVSLWNEI